MNNKITSLTSIIILFIIILLPAIVLAQGPGGDFPDDPGTPIDGGASLLVGAAALYGIKKMRDRKAKQK